MAVDNFESTDQIELQPGDSDVPYTFTFTVCSSATANDGFLPYGSTVSSVVVTGYDRSDIDVTSILIEGTSSLNGLVLTVNLNYPGIDGYYRLKMIATLGSGTVKEADFKRIEAKDI